MSPCLLDASSPAYPHAYSGVNAYCSVVCGPASYCGCRGQGQPPPAPDKAGIRGKAKQLHIVAEAMPLILAFFVLALGILLSRGGGSGHIPLSTLLWVVTSTSAPASSVCSCAPSGALNPGFTSNALHTSFDGNFS